jgi:hypothetical protein
MSAAVALESAFVGQIFSCFFMTGVIWLVQLVHYPFFAFVADDQFVQSHTFHTNRISWVVIPVMLVELGSAIALVFLDRGGFWLANLALLAMIWGSTALLSVPYHNKLAVGKSGVLVEKLTVSNWPRTFLWSVRSGGLIYWLLAQL